MSPRGFWGSKQARKQANRQTGKQASRQEGRKARKQARKHASKQVSNHASMQVRKQADKHLEGIQSEPGPVGACYSKGLNSEPNI